MARRSLTLQNGPSFFRVNSNHSIAGDIAPTPPRPNPQGFPQPQSNNPTSRDALLYYSSNETHQQAAPHQPAQKESGPFFRLSSQILRSQRQDPATRNSIDDNWLASGMSAAANSIPPPGLPTPPLNGGARTPPQPQQQQNVGSQPQRRSLTLHSGRISEESYHSAGSSGKKTPGSAGHGMETAVRQAHTMQLLLDPDKGGRILECSVGACRSLGFSRPELLSLTILDMVPSLSFDSWQDIVGQLSRGDIDFASLAISLRSREPPSLAQREGGTGGGPLPAAGENGRTAGPLSALALQTYKDQSHFSYKKPLSARGPGPGGFRTNHSGPIAGPGQPQNEFEVVQPEYQTDSHSDYPSSLSAFPVDLTRSNTDRSRAAASDIEGGGGGKGSGATWKKVKKFLKRPGKNGQANGVDGSWSGSEMRTQSAPPSSAFSDSEPVADVQRINSAGRLARANHRLHRGPSDAAEIEMTADGYYLLPAVLDLQYYFSADTADLVANIRLVPPGGGIAGSRGPSGDHAHLITGGPSDDDSDGGEADEEDDVPPVPVDLCGPGSTRLLELVGLGLVAISSESLSAPIKSCNEHAAQMLERPLQSLVGTSFLQMVEESDKMTFADAAHKAALGGPRSWTQVMVRLKKSGGLIVTVKCTLTAASIDTLPHIIGSSNPALGIPRSGTGGRNRPATGSSSDATSPRHTKHAVSPGASGRFTGRTRRKSASGTGIAEAAAAALSAPSVISSSGSTRGHDNSGLLFCILVEMGSQPEAGYADRLQLKQEMGYVASQKLLIEGCPIAAALVTKPVQQKGTTRGGGGSRPGEVVLNRRAERLLGYSSGQLQGLGQWLNALFQGNNGWHARKAYESWRGMIQQQHSQQSDTEMDDSPVYSSVFNYQRRNGTEVPIKVTSISHKTGDVWFISRAKDKRENASNFRLLFEQSWDPMMLLTEEGNVFECNSAAVKILKFDSKSSLLGTTPWSICPPLDSQSTSGTPPANIPQTLKELLRQPLVDGCQPRKRFEWVFKDSKGGVVQVEAQVQLMEKKATQKLWEDDEEESSSDVGEGGRGGGMPTFLMIWHDMTEVKKNYAELEEAKATAEKASKAKTQFLANMSHEIRTPMNGIIGVADMLLETHVSEDQKPLLEAIRSSSEGLLHVLSDILDLSKIENEKMVLDFSEWNLRDHLFSCMSLFLTRAKEKGIQLLSHVEPDVPVRVLADTVRVRQVLLNLLSNALKFTHKGSVQVKVSVVDPAVSGAEARRESFSNIEPLRVADVEKVLLQYDVLDTGIGITKEGQEKLFRAFQQADSSTCRKFGGTGLGLAICRALVNLMGGEIWISSKEGQGSCFSFTCCVGVTEEVVYPGAAPLDEESIVMQDADLADVPISGLVEIVGDAWTEPLKGSDTANGMLPPIISPVVQGFKEPRTRVSFAGSEGGGITSPEKQLPGVSGPATDDPRLYRVGSGGIVLKMISENKMPPAGIPKIVRSGSGSGSRFQAEARTVVEEAAQDGAKGTPAVRSTAEVNASYNSSIRRKSLSRKSFTEEQPRALPTPLRGWKVLLAEDNQVNQMVVTRMLKNMGLQYDVVDNGKKAVDACETNDYDLVLMDCHMPEMDGLEATTLIRESEIKRKRIEESGGPPGMRPKIIVALTASAFDFEKEACFNAGMNHFLTKPVRPKDLEEMMLVAAKGRGK